MIVNLSAASYRTNCVYLLSQYSEPVIVEFFGNQITKAAQTLNLFS